jgi:hypothetical protein
MLKNLVDFLCTWWIITLRKLRASQGHEHYEGGFEYNYRNSDDVENGNDFSSTATGTVTQ